MSAHRRTVCGSRGGGPLEAGHVDLPAHTPVNDDRSEHEIQHHGQEKVHMHRLEEVEQVGSIGPAERLGDGVKAFRLPGLPGSTCRPWNGSITMMTARGWRLKVGLHGGGEDRGGPG